MPIDTLGDEVQRVLRDARTFLSSRQPNSASKQPLLRDLAGVEGRLFREVEERSSTYLSRLDAEERREIDG
jgi:hypothetical protein